LAEGGRLICCDVSADWTALAMKYWQRAGLDDRIELRLGPALDTLRALPSAATFDLAFIDADKTGYASYWEEIVPRTRSGGIILVDNSFLHGRVFDPAPGDADARAVRDFNEQLLSDERVEFAMLWVGDGLTVARKKLAGAGTTARPSRLTNGTGNCPITPGKAMVTRCSLGHSFPAVRQQWRLACWTRDRRRGGHDRRIESHGCLNRSGVPPRS
jgi:hypothetical protein